LGFVRLKSDREEQREKENRFHMLRKMSPGADSFRQGDICLIRPRLRVPIDATAHIGGDPPFPPLRFLRRRRTRNGSRTGRPSSREVRPRPGAVVRRGTPAADATEWPHRRAHSTATLMRRRPGSLRRTNGRLPAVRTTDSGSQDENVGHDGGDPSGRRDLDCIAFCGSLVTPPSGSGASGTDHHCPSFGSFLCWALAGANQTIGRVDKFNR
jgi:hypothetical protein